MKTHIPRLILLLLVSLSLSLAACSSNKSNPTDPVKLNTPIGLQVTKATLKWNLVTNASGYKVQVNGTERDATGETFSLYDLITPGDAYEIKVMAKGDGTDYTDSDWSAAYTFTFDPINDLYELPANLVVNIGIFNETGAELGVITKDALAYIDQEVVVDNVTRHYIAYSMTEIFAYLGISTGFESALIEASDGVTGTVTSFDNAHLAVVRITTETGDQTTSGMPRSIPSNIQSVVKITLSGVATNPVNPTTPDIEFSIDNLEDFEIEISSDGVNQGVMTKAVLVSIGQSGQVEVPDPDARYPDRHYVTYPLKDVLDKMEISYAGFSSVLGDASDGYWVEGDIDDAYIAVVRRHANGDVQEADRFPRLLIPSGQIGPRGAAPVLENVVTITLEK